MVTYGDKSNIETEKYIVYLNEKQIISIAVLNNDNTEYEITHSIYNNDHIDTIKDIGIFPLTDEVRINTFIFKNNNCERYSYSYNTYNPIYPLSSPTHIESTDTLAYTEFINTKISPDQIIGAISSPGGRFSIILYFIGMEGYYILPPNKNLIDRIYSGDKICTFNYEFNNGKLFKCITNTNNVLTTKEFYYY